MHFRPPGRSERRIVPQQLETTLEVDDGIVHIGRARAVRRSRSPPPRAPMNARVSGMHGKAANRRKLPIVGPPITAASSCPKWFGTTSWQVGLRAITRSTQEPFLLPARLHPITNPGTVPTRFFVNPPVFVSSPG
jgi:hypothetical protein